MQQLKLKELNAGDEITVFKIGGCTIKNELVIVNFKEEQSKAFQICVTEKGKKKRIMYTPLPEHIVLRGHDLPLKCDSEFNIFLGNAQYNLVAESSIIAKKLLELSLIPLTAYHKSRILFFNIEEMGHADLEASEGVELYKEEGY